jgi:hypothetical protein
VNGRHRSIGASSSENNAPALGAFLANKSFAGEHLAMASK